MRALAAIAVMTFHFSSAGIWDAAPFSAVVEHGARGVFVFFVLSGFLVFRPFVEGPVDTGGYALKRVLRIMPAYIAALVLVTLLTGDPMLRQHPLEFLLLLQNYDLALFQHLVPTAWTLVLEMQFYLLLPMAALALIPVMRRWPALGAAVLVAVGLVSIVLLMWAYVVPPFEPAVIISSSLPALLWAFIPGMLVAQVLVTNPAAAARLATDRVALLAGGLICLGWMSGGTYLLDVLAELGLAVGVALLIPWLVRPRTHDVRPVRSLAWFGVVVSYPFYLWHRTVMDQVQPWHLAGATAWIVVLMLTTAVGVVSYWVIERPAIRLASRLSAGPHPAAAIRASVTSRRHGSVPTATAHPEG